MLGLFFFRLFLLRMPAYPAFVMTGAEVRNDGFTSEMLCCPMADGLHLGRGFDSAEDIGDRTDVEGSAFKYSADGEEEEIESRDPASLMICESYSSSSQTSMRRAISKMREDPPDSVVCFGAVSVSPASSSSSVPPTIFLLLDIFAVRLYLIVSTPPLSSDGADFFRRFFAINSIKYFLRPHTDVVAGKLMDSGRGGANADANDVECIAAANARSNNPMIFTPQRCRRT
mmetsp:Transcript_37688/g.80513  ORF Transcript_37688/g.80513 Transcript_37688/m.80513 type:complete len:229 (-) Transcript_37688:99-785(-)